MKGTTLLKINHETLVEAIQLYLDSGQMPNQKIHGVFLSAKDGCYISAGQKVQELVVEVVDSTTPPVEEPKEVQP